MSVTVVAVASHRDAKNYPNLLRGDSIRGSTPGHPIRLVSVGDGPNLADHVALAVELGLGDLVTFAPATDDVLVEIAAADMFVVASDYEGQPIVVTEALALRRCRSWPPLWDGCPRWSTVRSVVWCRRATLPPARRRRSPSLQAPPSCVGDHELIAARHPRAPPNTRSRSPRPPRSLPTSIVLRPANYVAHRCAYSSPVRPDSSDRTCANGCWPAATTSSASTTCRPGRRNLDGIDVRLVEGSILDPDALADAAEFDGAAPMASSTSPPARRCRARSTTRSPATRRTPPARCGCWKQHAGSTTRTWSSRRRRRCTAPTRRCRSTRASPPTAQPVRREQARHRAVHAGVPAQLRVAHAGVPLLQRVRPPPGAGPRLRRRGAGVRARRAARRTAAVHGDGTQSRDFTYVGTVSEVIVDAVTRGVTHNTPVNLAFGAGSRCSR